jgi:5,10-methylenetetrahydrofolate reductase
MSMSSSFAEGLRAGRFAVALEITPPQKPLPEVLRRRARMIGDAADAVNVIHRPGRMSSLVASIDLLEAGLEPVWHVASRGRSRVDLVAEIEMAASRGIRCALCIRGDHEGRDRSDTPKLRELVGLLRARLGDGLVGATANQYGPRERVVANLLPKLESGAGVVQTQPIFEWEAFSTLADAIKQHAPDTRIVPMLMPLLSGAAARAVSKRLHVQLSGSLLGRLDQGGEEAGWALFEEELARLHESPLADGVAIMTREMDPPPTVTGRVARSILQLRR